MRFSDSDLIQAARTAALVCQRSGEIRNDLEALGYVLALCVVGLVEDTVTRQKQIETLTAERNAAVADARMYEQMLKAAKVPLANEGGV